MDSLKTWRTINPTQDEVNAATLAFGELPALDAVAQLVMVRRAVAAGFYTDEMPDYRLTEL